MGRREVHPGHDRAARRELERVRQVRAADDDRTRPQLETDLALRYLLDGDYAASAKTFATTKAESKKLGVDPFVIHINECHDCDQAKYANAPWTRASFVAKLAELVKTANGTGEAAADASMQLGAALYNITWFGNSRVVLGYTHEESQDTRTAERWFKRAYDLTSNREKKAKAAYLAAKCERGRRYTDLPPPDPASQAADPDVTPRTWFATLKQYANTSYYKEVLAECGTFSAWLGAGAPK